MLKKLLSLISPVASTLKTKELQEKAGDLKSLIASGKDEDYKNFDNQISTYSIPELIKIRGVKEADARGDDAARRLIDLINAELESKGWSDAQTTTRINLILTSGSVFISAISMMVALFKL